MKVEASTGDSTQVRALVARLEVVVINTRILIANAIAVALLLAYPGAIGSQTTMDGAGEEGSPGTASAHPYQLPNFIGWNQQDLVILIIPPAHGPLASTQEGVLPNGPDGALPTGAYLDATLHVMADWRYALDQGAIDLDIPWMAEIQWELRVVPEHLVMPEDVQEADIVKIYTETTYPILGAAANTGNLLFGLGPGCVAYSTMWMTYGSLSYEDMYKLAGHELGHCMGPSHTLNDWEGLDIMRQGGYPQHELRCPSNLNALAVASAFAAAFDAETGPDPRSTVSVERDAYERYCDEDNDPR